MLRMSSRIDAVASRVETAVKMQAVCGPTTARQTTVLTCSQVTKSMGSVVSGMDKVMASMDLMQV